MSTPGPSGPAALARLSTAAIRPWLGAEPIFSQTQHERDLADPEVASLQAARLRGAPIVFLGLHEDEDASHALPSSEFSAKKENGAEAVIANVHGTPYFSVDVSELDEGSVSAVLQSTDGNTKLEFMDGRAAMGSLTQFDSAVFAEARSLVDWSARNRVGGSVAVYGL
jgi:NAD+ diphosphatase